MKAISLRPAGTAINFRILAVFSQFLANFGVSIAAIGAIVCFTATICDADALAAGAAFSALIGVYPSTKSQKGGVR